MPRPLVSRRAEGVVVIRCGDSEAPAVAAPVAATKAGAKAAEVPIPSVESVAVDADEGVAAHGAQGGNHRGDRETWEVAKEERLSALVLGVSELKSRAVDRGGREGECDEVAHEMKWWGNTLVGAIQWRGQYNGGGKIMVVWET